MGQPQENETGMLVSTVGSASKPYDSMTMIKILLLWSESTG